VHHFEKMLYDNAQLARIYLHGWQALGTSAGGASARRRSIGRLREMRGPEGGFYSALDADSEGEEGRFYVWTPGGDPRGAGRGRRPSRSTTTGSASGQLRGRATSSTCAGGDGAGPRAWPRRAGRSTRRARSACGRGSTTSASPPGTRWRLGASPRRARRSAARTTSTRRATAPSSCCGDCATTSGRLLRTYKDGEARLNAYLEDHAFLLEALLTLYEASFEPRWFEEAGARRDDDRPLRRRRARRLLLDLRATTRS
jgi:hypothetical protein